MGERGSRLTTEDLQNLDGVFAAMKVATQDLSEIIQDLASSDRALPAHSNDALWTLRDCAETFVGLQEIRGERHHPMVVAMLNEFASWVADDETAWCGAFTGFVCRVMGYPTPGPERWRALQARRWLSVGEPVNGVTAADANTLVILKRGDNPQPGPEELDAPGHVGFYVESNARTVSVLGGNQSNAVNVKPFTLDKVLGLRRMTRRA